LIDKVEVEQINAFVGAWRVLEQAPIWPD